MTGHRVLSQHLCPGHSSAQGPSAGACVGLTRSWREGVGAAEGEVGELGRALREGQRPAWPSASWGEAAGEGQRCGHRPGQLPSPGHSEDLVEVCRVEPLAGRSEQPAL